MFPTKKDSDSIPVPLASFTGRAPFPRKYSMHLSGSYWARGGEVFPPAQEFGKRSDVSRILMPTAPTRIKPRPHVRHTVLPPQEKQYN